MQAQFCFLPQFFFLVCLFGLQFKGCFVLFCFVLFCFVFFWLGFQAESVLGFAELCFLFCPLILVKAFLFCFVFSVHREWVCKNPGGQEGERERERERERIQDVNKTTLLLFVVAAASAAALTLWLSSGCVFFVCVFIPGFAVLPQLSRKRRRKEGACAFSRAGGRGQGEGGKKKQH
jgi:hypothetical protein